MTEFSLKPLSEGLGFYEKNPNFNSFDRKASHIQKTDSLASLELPDAVLPEKLDLDNFQTYEHLISLLEKPWLGEDENNLNSENKAQSSAGDVFTSSDMPASAAVFVPPPPACRPTSSTAPPPDSVSSTQEKACIPINTKEKKPASSQVFVKENKMKHTLSSSAHLLFEKTFYFSLKAYLIDICVVSLLFFPPLILFTFLTTLDPVATLLSVWLTILFSFLLFAQVYCLLCRLFCFETYGEAVAKIRLFTLRSREAVHPFVLFFRFLLSCLTGIFLLPLLSLIFKRDFMARLTGLYFQKT